MPRKRQLEIRTEPSGMQNDALNEGVLHVVHHSFSKFWRIWIQCLAWIIPFCPVEADQIIFSEVMYHPRQENNSAWIECVNLTATPFDCAEWTLDGKALEYNFPPFDRFNAGSSFIKPFERFLITEAEPNEFRAQYQIPSEIRIWGPWKGKIDRGSEKLVLTDRNGVALCQLDYDNDPPWPIESTGAGYSIVIKHSDKTVNHWGNWKASSKPGGTPGLASFPEEGLQFQIQTSETELNRELLVPMNVAWRYHEGHSELGQNWMTPDFDDSSWSNGEGLLGFEGDALPAPGIRTHLSKGPLSYYFRTQFNMTTPITDSYLEVNQVVDDGAVYYLNGKEIGSSRMSGNRNQNRHDAMAIEFVEDAVLEENVIRIHETQLKQGENIIAVAVHQADNTSTDLVFGAEIWAITRNTPLPLNIVELGIAQNSEAYVIIENTSGINEQLADYTISAANNPNQTMRTVAILPSVMLKPREQKKISLDRNISLRADISISKPNEGISGSNIPIRLPKAGFKQRLFNPIRNIWKVEAIESITNELSSKPMKGKIQISEIVFPDKGEMLSVELYHSHAHTISLSGLALAHQSKLDQAQSLDGQVAPNALTVVDFKGLPKGKKRLKLFLLNQADGEVLDAVSVRIQPGKSCQRSVLSQHGWFASNLHSLGSLNQLDFQSDIIINEIMYAPPFGQDDLEFIEILNKGSKSIQLDGWKLQDGIEYNFPKGTRLEPSRHLVIAKNPEKLVDAHSGLACLGPFKGKLGNNGERIRLLDENGNLADQVDYRCEGDWPELARGKGSSMELIHPDMDNSLSSAWKDSRESRTSEFQKFHFTTRYQGYEQRWHPMDHQELHLYLVGESHVVLRNIQFRKKGHNRNLIINPGRISIEGDGSTGWLIQGNHADSFIENERLHLIAHGHGDNRANRAEIDLTELSPGDTYEIDFEARWVHGSPRFIVRTWENSLSESVLLPIPRNLGTPGAPNSNLRSYPSPLVETLLQSPAVGAPSKPLSITASVGWPAETGIVNLVYRLDGAPDSPWNREPMAPRKKTELLDHSLTTYQAILEREFKQGQLIQYYVEAISRNGQRNTLPRKPVSQPALCIFDGREIPRDLRVIRMLISDHHLQTFSNTASQKYQYRYPRLSNQYFNSTFISNERDVFHGAELRTSGSPWTRRQPLDRGKFRLPKDRLFRDHGKFTYDNDPTRNRGSVRHHNRIARYLLYLLGHVSGQNEFVYVIINSGRVVVKEDVEPVDADYLKRNFKNGNQGELYRIDDDWWMSDHWSQVNRDASWNYLGSDHPALYRHSWMKRSQEEKDDYSNFIAFIKLINRSDYTQDEIESVLDADAVLKMTAVMGFIADWDTFTQARGKNAYFYQRPGDRKFQLLHWDADLAFGQRRHNSFYGGSQQFKDWVEKKYNYSRLIQYLNQLATLTKDPQGRVEAWMREESYGHPDTRMNTPFYRKFFKNRSLIVEQLN